MANESSVHAIHLDALNGGSNSFISPTTTRRRSRWFLALTSMGCRHRPLSHCALYGCLLPSTPAIIHDSLFYPRQIEWAKLVQSSLEVVQDNSVGKKFEDEREFPERIEAVRQDLLESVCDWKDIHNSEDDGEYHGHEHDSKAWRDNYELEILEIISGSNVVEKRKACKYPPGITNMSISAHHSWRVYRKKTNRQRASNGRVCTNRSLMLLK